MREEEAVLIEEAKRRNVSFYLLTSGRDVTKAASQWAASPGAP